ncbi:hypothetical protein AB0L70_16355 [Kribbella sp. NPDC051952]|uniref:hypothetical protein n=1 Tax=Kribbella sp. NPDC051952 TaxID=3154851 RepID=UPI00341F7861
MTVLADQDALLRAARHAATRLSARLSRRPRAVVTAEDYADLHERLLAYLRARFKTCLDDSQYCTIVQRSIDAYVAPYYVAGTPKNPMDPEDLFKHIIDAALEEYKASGISTAGVDGLSDDELVQETFGAHANAAVFRAALAQLRLEDKQIDYLVVHQFADLFDEKLRKPAWQEVVDRLRNPQISTARVESIVLRFSNRLSLVAAQ